MNLFFTRRQLLVMGWLTVALGGLAPGAQAQLTVTGTNPARNANAAPRPGNVALTYSQAINPTTGGTVRVFSQQAGGRKAFASATVSGSTVTLDPAQDFKPGEVVFVTAPATVLSTGGVAAVPYVYQFTTQAGAGSGTFGGGSDPTVGTDPYAVTAADVDGDDDLDLLTANNNGGSGLGTVSVRLNTGSGTFSGGSEVAVGDLPRDIVTADVDGDGDLDLLTANLRNSGSNTVSVRLNNGSGSFGGGSEVAVGLGPNKLAVGDVDGDGDLDLVTANATNVISNGVGNSTVSVRLNNGSGSFGGAQDVSVGGANSYPWDVALADVDSDGDLDVLATVYLIGSSSTVSVRLNNGAGVFTAPATGAQVSVVGNGYGVVTMADVDGDGDLDLLAAYYGNTVNVRFNNGAGVFTAPATGAQVSISSSLTFSVSDVATADVDGDGDLDLLTANDANSGGTMSVRLNNGSGLFAGGQDLGVGVGPYGIAVADVDGDGDVDVLTANRRSNTVSVRLNQFAVPTLTSFTPLGGVAGTSVVLTGTNFTGATSVTFNGVAATSFVVNSATQITVSVPAGATTGLIAVTTPGGTATSTTSFTVIIGWTGATSTDWFTASNWTTGVPTASQDALINPSSFGRQPLISAGTAIARNVVINAGASLTMSGGTLDVRGDWTNNSTFTATDGTVIFGAASAATLPGPNLYGSSPSRFWNLSVQANGLRVVTAAGTAVQRVLALTGNLTTLGNPLTLLSSPTGGDALVVNSGGVVVGTATVQRAIDPRLNTGLGYHHYSSPVSNSTVADLATTASGGSFTPVVNPAYNTSATPNAVGPFPNIFGYDQSRVTLVNNYAGFDKGWFSPAALTDPLLVGQGYTVSIGAGEVVDFQGTLNNGDVPLALSRNSGAGAADGGWQLLGNPYPAPLDYSRVASSDRLGLEEAIYVFSSTGTYAGQYRAYVNGLGGNPVLPVAQGFFVHVNAGQTSASLIFRNSQRLTAPNSTTFQRPAPETRPLVQLMLRSAAGPLADEAYVYFQAGATTGADAAYDAVKLVNPSGLNLATVAAGNDLAINGLPLASMAACTVPLTVQVPASGVYTLEAAQLLNLTDTPVYLRDKQLGILTDLRQQPTYSFTLHTASAAARFELVFNPAPLSTATAQAVQVLLYPNPAHGQVTLEVPVALCQRTATLTLADALGRPVRAQELPAGQATHVLPLAGLAPGLYLLHLQTEVGLVVKKLVIE